MTDQTRWAEADLKRLKLISKSADLPPRTPLVYTKYLR
jgi:hypothetical protein